MSKPLTTADPSDSICVLQCLDNPSWNRSCINCEKHRELKARLADMRRLVVALENELAEFRSSIGEKNDPITTTFPLEITAHIFKHYVSLHEKIDQYAVSDGIYLISRRVALGLGAVCRLWRRIAWSIPQLWTRLVVDLQAQGYAHGPKLLKQWLNRTKGLPLDVRVYLGCADERPLTYQEETNARSAMKVLNRFFSQIKCLNAELLPFSLVSALTELGPDATSNLQRLALGGYTEGYPYEQDVALFRISGTHPHKTPHRPTHVSLSSSIQFHKLNIQWANVTHVYLECVTQATSFCVIKAAAQRLKYINFGPLRHRDDDRTDFDVEDWLPASPIKLPSLVSLDMHSHAEFMEVVFNSIDCPSLTSLQYSHLQPERLMPVTDAVIACIQRSSCSIKNLRLDWPQHAQHDVSYIIRVLHELPALESLELLLMSGQSVEPIFLALAGQDGGRGATSKQTTFLCNLKYLKLNVYPLFSWTSFVNIWLTPQSRLPNGVAVGSHAHQRKGNLEVDPARNDLSVSMAVRGELEPSQHYVGKNELLALMPMLKVLRGSISVTADGRTSMFVAKEDEYDLLKRSFLRHFPTDSKYLPLLESIKKSSSFQ